MGRYYEVQSGPWYQVRTWSRKTWALVALGIAIVIVVVVPVAVVETRKNAYPNYNSLSYKLVDSYSGETFFDKFNYFTGYDPANGFVHYVPKEQAESLNLTSASSTAAVVRVDTSVGPSSVPNAETGRFSVRLESKTQYTNGLFIFDVRHTPYGCGTWPALWMVDPNNNIWPAHGEIDIMEASNQATSGNAVTLHTSGDCTMSGVKRKMTGSAQQADCHNTTNGNAGCGVEGSDDTFGAAFNSAGGGVVAVEWREAGIRIWQFDGSKLPSDLSLTSAASGSSGPDPSTWGRPLADFPDTSCSISNHFQNASIIANIDLCGALAGGLYQKSGCPLPCVGDHKCIGGTAPTNCTDYVANNPTAFENAYWEFGSFLVYQAS